uniref:MIT domain-containing protein n=1 Tax=Ditylenchus dipsaci TaxID=166011 RepID=A0A915DSJ1_9BILA
MGARCSKKQRSNNWTKAVSFVSQACQADTCRNYSDAIKLYTKGLKYFMKSLENDRLSDSEREEMLARMKNYMDRALQLKEFTRMSKEKQKEELRKYQVFMKELEKKGRGRLLMDRLRKNNGLKTV